MGKVMVEVSFRGMLCDLCEFESSTTELQEYNWCDLFDKPKEYGRRCAMCVGSTLTRGDGQ